MLSRLRRMSRGGWITVGIVLGAIIAPGVALAAFSDIRIVGVGGTPTAQVTQANQLQVAEADPSRIRRFKGRLDASNQCVTFNAPAGSAFMLKQAVIDVQFNDTPGRAVYVYAGKNCSDPVASTTPVGVRAQTTIPFEPGIVIPSGGGFSVGSSGLDAWVYLLGYTMPAGAVPGH